MGVGRQAQAEMPEPVGRVARLHLRAQHLLHDLGPAIVLADQITKTVIAGTMQLGDVRTITPFFDIATSSTSFDVCPGV